MADDDFIVFDVPPTLRNMMKIISNKFQATFNGVQLAKVTNFVMSCNNTHCYL